MTKLAKYLSLFVVVCILLLFACIPVLGIDGISSLFGCNIENISISRQAMTYEFSLVERFPIVLLVGLICVGYFASIAIWTDQFIVNTKECFRFLKSYFLDTIRLISKSNVKYFLLLSFGTTIYLAYAFPLTLDEPQTYFDFVKPPFWEALAFYPYPNNHVFFSVLANITNELSWVDILFRIRMPVILVSLLTWAFAYRLVKKHFSENVALFVVAIGTVVITNLQHAYIARGYAFVMFFVVIGIYAAFNIVRDGNRQRDWVVFTLSSVLGAWTMPSYLYPFLSISIFVFIYNYKNFKTQFFYSVLVGVFVFLLYSPILVFTGLEAITSNEFVATIDRMTVLKSIPGFMLGVAVHIFYMSHYIVIGAFVVLGLYLLVKRDKDTLIIWAVFCITPVLFLILHSVLPFFRTFFYYGFIFIFLIGITFKEQIEKVKPAILFPVLLVAHCAGLFLFFNVSKDLMPEVFQSDAVVKEVLEDGKTYYMHNRISWIQMNNLDFEAERKGYTIASKGGAESDVEKVVPQYDYYLMDKETNRTSEDIHSDEMMGIFSRPIQIYKKEDIDKID